VCGEGEPTILLVPSVGITEVFNPQINYFSEKCKVVTLDLRGTGESDKPRGEYTIDMYVSDIASEIKDLQEKNIILIGFSAGGLMAIKIVASHPERISKLVLWATNPAPLLNMTDDKKKRSAEFLEKATKSPSWGVKKFWETIFSQPESEHLIEWGLKSAQKTPPEIFINSFKNYWK
jgi:pimeloyl-ACP methyl ester carboxylesterase